MINLGDQEEISLHCSNIPSEFMRFSETREIYWEVELIAFKRNEGRLYVRVVDYQSKKKDRLGSQQAKYPIKYIEFESFVWKKLEPLLSVYQKKELRPFLLEKTKLQTEVHQTSLSFRVPLGKTTFGMGFVSFHKDLKWRRPSTEIKIPHPESLPEYDYIKFYFVKFLGKKTIDVEIIVESTSEEHKIASVRSLDLEKISKDTVEILKVGKLEEWTSRKPKLAPPDQNLFTIEDAMASYGDEALGNIDILEKDLLFHIMEKEGARDKLQLRYLSEHIHEGGERWILTLVPQFGFLYIH